MTGFYRKAHESWSAEAISNTAKIREINDRHRKAGSAGPARFFISGELASESDEIHAEALRLTREFDAFTEDNDSHGEHDMGTFKVNGEPAMFKIDYLDFDMEHASETPWIERSTQRVISIFYMRDY